MAFVETLGVQGQRQTNHATTEIIANKFHSFNMPHIPVMNASNYGKSKKEMGSSDFPSKRRVAMVMANAREKK
ncbi:hypothetical protein TNCV_3730731 [Trichonephila clavipes]|nr:hypothetical protein TNCV_3730731 [Trichonephila clavipes]